MRDILFRTTPSFLSSTVPSGKHVVFGHVVEGLEILQRISKVWLAMCRYSSFRIVLVLCPWYAPGERELIALNKRLEHWGLSCVVYCKCLAPCRHIVHGLY
jgi:cyclophilin family peptidyl-prolyl cis-trans isomerase